jgi:predicted pyridoxine 5'-phosphate oxidase superfamily flavin-nucleotide-binding protein
MAFSYHEGERRRQDRAGVREMAELNAGGVADAIPWAAAEFLAEQPFVVVGHRDAKGGVWASVLHGPPGFARALDARTIAIDAHPADGDALAESVERGALALGLIALEPATRRRMRVNGDAHVNADGQIILRAEEVYSNCPKYISTRVPETAVSQAAASSAERGTSVSAEQRALISHADTFFVATSHAIAGADVSHRGGRPGFVVANEDGTRLTWPDYRGNSMFMTLGNLDVDPAAGLVFPDWATGDVLQVRGRARVDDDRARAAAFPRAERVVDLDIEEVVALPGALGDRWRFGELSKVSPPVAA